MAESGDGQKTEISYAQGSYEFVYAASWLSSSLSRPLSLSMLLREQKFSGDVVHSFFDNLLPDNDVIRSCYLFRIDVF